MCGFLLVFPVGGGSLNFILLDRLLTVERLFPFFPGFSIPELLSACGGVTRSGSIGLSELDTRASLCLEVVVAWIDVDSPELSVLDTIGSESEFLFWFFQVSLPLVVIISLKLTDAPKFISYSESELLIMGVLGGEFFLLRDWIFLLPSISEDEISERSKKAWFFEVLLLFFDAILALLLVATFCFDLVLPPFLLTLGGGSSRLLGLSKLPSKFSAWFRLIKVSLG